MLLRKCFDRPMLPFDPLAGGMARVRAVQDFMEEHDPDGADRREADE